MRDLEYSGYDGPGTQAYVFGRAFYGEDFTLRAVVGWRVLGRLVRVRRRDPLAEAREVADAEHAPRPCQQLQALRRALVLRIADDVLVKMSSRLAASASAPESRR